MLGNHAWWTCLAQPTTSTWTMHSMSDPCQNIPLNIQWQLPKPTSSRPNTLVIFYSLQHRNVATWHGVVKKPGNQLSVTRNVVHVRESSNCAWINCNVYWHHEKFCNLTVNIATETRTLSSCWSVTIQRAWITNFVGVNAVSMKHPDNQGVPREKY